MGKLLQKFFGRRLNEKGQEVPDPTPVELPLGYKHPLPLDERIKRMIRTDLSVYANEKFGSETWEEANDFDTGEDAGEFPDEDFTPNDPFLEQAARVERQRLQDLEKKAALPKGKDEPAKPVVS